MRKDQTSSESTTPKVISGATAGVATDTHQAPTAKANPRQATATKAPARRILARRILRKLVFAAGVILWTLASYYAASHLGALIFSLWVDAGDLRSSAPLMALFLTIIYIIELILLILVPWGAAHLWRRHGAKQATLDTHAAPQVNTWAPTRQTLGLTGWPRWRDLALAPAGLIVSLIVSGVVISLCLNLPGFDVSAEQNLGFDQYLIQWDLLAAFVALVIVPPICEEIAYRGWLYGKLRSRWGSVVSSLLVSLTFAVLHAPLNAAIVAFVLSFVACGLREITGSIYASMIMHMLKNGIAFWLLYVVHLG